MKSTLSSPVAFMDFFAPLSLDYTYLLIFMCFFISYGVIQMNSRVHTIKLILLVGHIRNGFLVMKRRS